jgi:hypothetical protein
MRALAWIAVTSSVAIGASPLAAQTMRTMSVSRPMGGERMLRVTLDYTGGSLIVAPASDGALYGLQLRYDADRSAPINRYDARTGILHIGLTPSGGAALRVADPASSAQRARITVSPNLPLVFDADLGGSEAAIDLGGTMLSEIDIHANATHSSVDFSRPTRGNCRRATFTVGAADIDVHHLAAAGCTSVRVEGGAGGATLRFDGEWRSNATLDVDLSMGRLTLVMVRGTGLRVTGQRFLAPLSRNGLVAAGDGWMTPGFGHAAHTLDVNLKASLVGIDVQWVDR